MKVAVILNPKAGLPKLLPYIKSRIEHKLSDFGYQVSIYEIHPEKNGYSPTELALQQGAEMIISAGGDGTINNSAKLLTHTEIPLAIIPLGSGNGLARTLGIPLELEKALNLLKNPIIQKIDTGKVNGDLFLISCGFGIDADIAHDFEKTHVRGIFPYVVSGIRRFFTEELETYQITDLETNETWKGEALVTCVANSEQYGGGAIVAPNASPEDGYLELLEGLPVRFLEAVQVGIKLFNGSLDKEPKLKRKKIKKILYKRLSKRLVMHRDGEACFSKVENIIEIDPLSLHVVIGPSYKFLNQTPHPNGQL
ncbi:MAG: diacylglycerol kinase family protein [bacterium]|nr:diacylglycerol kinase family protein [bacterium]